jgi:predicted acylesterase/phospholipase RssA
MAQDSSSNDQTFEIGLVLAGAVSAGAYTSGVIDFLLEALEQWEAAKRRGDPDVPPHNVRIKVITGTSAGAITAAVLTSSLRADLKPVRALQPGPNPANKLYDAWVDRVDIFPLLDNGDLSYGHRVQSVLNSDALDAIAKVAVSVSYSRQSWPTYVSDPLQVYLCTTNLRGVPYSIQFAGEEGSVGYGMSLHADYMRFLLSATPRGEEDALPLDLHASGGNWDVMTSAALASGAFPIGLSARVLTRKAGDYNRRPWHIASPQLVDGKQVSVDREMTIDPSWPKTVNQQPDGYAYEFVNVDGGVINNEPVELARRALAGIEGRNPRDPDKATRAVLMVDPFPNEVNLDLTYDAQKRKPMLTAAMDLLSAMIYQMRFKVEELELARDEGVFSRFVISPVRWERGATQSVRARFAMACGALGGFGGFLSRDFRHHDFLLGRINCQQFLREHFYLDASNPVFDGWSRDLKAKLQVKRTYSSATEGQTRRSDIDALSIIPLLGTAAGDAIDGGYNALVWPKGKGPDMGKLEDALMNRMRALVNHVLKTELEGSIVRQYLRLTWGGYRFIKWITRDSPVAPIMNKIKTDLALRGLL